MKRVAIYGAKSTALGVYKAVTLSMEVFERNLLDILEGM